MHSLVDTIVDFLTAATQTAARDRLAASESNTSEASAAAPIPIIRAKGPPARPGEQVSMSISMRNDDPTASADLNFFATDLVASADDRIPGSCVGISPPSIRLAPGGSADVIIRLNVPSDGPPGTYQGLLLATGDDNLQAIVSVRVVASSTGVASSFSGK